MSHIEIRLFGWGEGGSKVKDLCERFRGKLVPPLTSAMFS